MALYVHTSNRSEQLVEALVEVVRGGPPGDDPCVPETIAVQGKGMERWLSQQLARRLGVWANFAFPFPRVVVDRILCGVLSPDAGAVERAPDPERETWRIARVLRALLAAPGAELAGFASIRRYLQDDADGVRRIELSARIANTFDHYAVYRPDMVLQWEELAPRAEDDWQPRLWRALADDARARGLASPHAAARRRAFDRALSSSSGPIPGLPARLSLFGATTLPPAWLGVLRGAAERHDVHLFLLSPSSHYWAEIRSRRELARDLAHKDVLTEADEEALAAAVGNPLLASLGRVGREMQATLESFDYQDGRAEYVEPGAATMLQIVQSDILHLRHRGAGAVDASPVAVDARDRSISVHACHGPMREVEVLHDQLLALFEELPDIEARDVVVMTPDIAAYAPAIEAVFGSLGAARGEPRIPYKIADLSAAATNEVVAAFFAVLDVAASRMTAPRVVDLLQLAPLRARFRIEADELDPIKTWIRRTGIRWGVDEDHRAELGQPRDRANTWRFGLDRLLTGYALPGRDRTLWRDVLPFDDIEGDAADLLGRFAAFCEALFEVRTALQGPRTIPAWRDVLENVLGRMLDDAGTNAHEHQLVADCLAAWQERAAAALFDEAVPLKVARAELTAALTAVTPARRFLAQGATFCELVPMRTIPFRVVCLMGLHAEAFPRGRWPLGFDLTADRRRVGDRSPRDDDRQLFLEALLSARDRFLVTYVGQSIQDNASLPPSVVVDELLDALGEGFDVPSVPDDDAAAPPDRAAAIRRHVVVRHPLQPFSPAYFRADRDPRFAAFSPGHFAGAQALVGERVDAAPFVTGALPELPGELVVSVDELVRFYEHPVRAFLQRRLGLFLDDGETDLLDREPLVLDPLQKSELGRFLLAPALDGDGVEAAVGPLGATGKVPRGAVGEELLREAREQTEAILEAHLQLVEGGPLPPLSVDGMLGDVRLKGVVSSLWRKGHVATRSRAMGATYEPAVWVRHLVLCWAGTLEHPRDSWIIGKKEGVVDVVHLRRCDEAERHLTRLVEIYRLGMQRPLPYFPRVAWEYARALQKRPDEASALAAARKEYEGGFEKRGAAADAFVRQVYGDLDPFDDDARLAEGLPTIKEELVGLVHDVLGPLFAHREERT